MGFHHLFSFAGVRGVLRSLIYLSPVTAAVAPGFSPMPHVFPVYLVVCGDVPFRDTEVT